MTPDTVLHALQTTLARHPEGVSIPELQVKLYRESGHKLSYQEIENTFFRYPMLFREEDGNWAQRKE